MRGLTTHWCTEKVCIRTADLKLTTRTWWFCSSTSSYEAGDERIPPHVQFPGRRCRGCVPPDGGERASGRAALHGSAGHRAGPRRCSGGSQKGGRVLCLPWGDRGIRGPHVSAPGGPASRLFVSPARFLQAGPSEGSLLFPLADDSERCPPEPHLHAPFGHVFFVTYAAVDRG